MTIHHQWLQRKKLRLNHYSTHTAYFITISCKKGFHAFGAIQSGRMQLSEFGKTAHDEWLKIPQRFNNVELDVFQVMPDHMHGIIFTNGPITCAVYNETKISKPEIADISQIIGAYKSCVAVSCLQLFKSGNSNRNPEPKLGKIWHRSFYDHVIRNDRALQNIRNYIINNPANWKKKY